MFTKNFYIASVAYNTIANVGNSKLNALCYYSLTNIAGNKCERFNKYGVENGGGTLINVSGLSGYNTHPKKEKSKLVAEYVTTSSFSPVYGVLFGNGTEPESVDNYTMSGELFTTYTYSSTVDVDWEDGGVATTVVYTLTNTGAEDFTVSEIGLVGYASIAHANNSSDKHYNNILLERTLLDTPITIPGNNGVGQITYTLRYDYPTA